MQALSNLEAFVAPYYQGDVQSIWHRLPTSRRSAVLVLLFFGQFGELRVVLTKRSSKLRSFPGHISFPGGRADTGLESPWMVARRETHEEIGLSANDAQLSQNGLTVRRLTHMPCYLSRTFSAVAPCVALLRMDDASQAVKLALNPGESSHIFSVPLSDFLYPKQASRAAQSEIREPEALERTFHKTRWGGIPWNLRSYTFPQKNPAEIHWLREMEDLSETDEEGEGESETGEPQIHGQEGQCNDARSQHQSNKPECANQLNETSHQRSNETRGRNQLEQSHDQSEENQSHNQSEEHQSHNQSDQAQNQSHNQPDQAQNQSHNQPDQAQNQSHNQPDQAQNQYSKQAKPRGHLSSWGKLGSWRDPATNEKIYDIWGLTANILHDIARIAYAPDTAHETMGEEELIWSVWHYGKQMATKQRSPQEAALIASSSASGASFGDIMPRSEFLRLKRLYKM